jgi:hypothetical protein
MLGIGFPLLAGVVADAHGLAAALWLYAGAACMFVVLVASTSGERRGAAGGSGTAASDATGGSRTASDAAADSPSS